MDVSFSSAPRAGEYEEDIEEEGDVTAITKGLMIAEQGTLLATKLEYSAGGKRS